ncbi:hypothetical protein BFR40_07395 [Brochothrix thermosphacta]|uniref:DUF2977 domain-containing protein n=1 Tax=Brochothrix thermosphacta TaxID=2756 RepID=UPI00083F8EFD|nr:DUF2977 domain-containing protein [Brochothrix thermosphacta]ODJ51812.1 hypothetical protein BFR40_07395 [Brochothrix thermosphacta]
MQIKINADSEIISYAVIGDVENGITVECEVIPENFEADFKPLYFVYKDKEIRVNENYKEPNENGETPANDYVEVLEELILQVAALTNNANKGDE